MNPVIRENNYGALDYRKVVVISEKLRDSRVERLFGSFGVGATKQSPSKKMRDSRAERLFGSFGVRAAKQSPKKKSLDALIRRLQDAA
ncbi:hypothetical protein AMTRI_Chr06g194980 [Amborella trichopoda]